MIKYDGRRAVRGVTLGGWALKRDEGIQKNREKGHDKIGVKL